MKFLLLAALLCCAGLTVANEQPVRYDNYRVYNVELSTEQQLKSFAELTRTLDLNTLSDFSRPGQTYQVAVPPSAVSIFEARSAALKVKFHIVIQELQKALESIFTRFDGILNPKLNWTHYHNLDTIYNWFDSRRLKFPLFIKPYIIGYSYEGRPIKAAKISIRRGNKAIFIESNIHAIEWITSATSTCFLNNLLSSGRPELLRLLIKYDWIFVPIANPDGFAYSHKINALWRKNRKPTGYTNSSGICYGVDLNRNFDFYWGESGYNVKEPCDHFYGGKAPHSEPESQALSRFILSFPPGYIRMYLALHSYGNLVLLPYGHSITEFPPEYDQMMNISSGFTTAAEATHGTKFKAGASGLLLNIVSGAVKDFAYGVAKIPYTATIELRDRGQYGFFLPRDQIQPTCDEFTNGVIGLVAKAEEVGLFK